MSIELVDDICCLPVDQSWWTSGASIDMGLGVAPPCVSGGRMAVVQMHLSLSGDRSFV
jgi:hypothetical protein